YAMNDADSYCGIIGDGTHVDPELVKLALRAKKKDRLYFVSDASPAAGAEKAQPFKMSGVMAYPQDKICVNESGTIVGAKLTLGECVVEAIKRMKLPPETVLRMASTIPAAFLGLDKKFGYLLPNFEADIVALDHNFKATAVWRSGEKVF
ncbi:MAG: amidohydrolase family protein, partial [Alphaproteobacteria bacterium]|nr:amidohydrolase family protein [Alphaproteobacteria bacterium]